MRTKLAIIKFLPAGCAIERTLWEKNAVANQCHYPYSLLRPSSVHTHARVDADNRILRNESRRREGETRKDEQHSFSVATKWPAAAAAA